MEHIAENFNSPEFSDVVLQLVSGGSAGSSGPGTPRKRRGPDADGATVRSFYLHKLVLSEAEYFKAQIQRWRPQQQQSPAPHKQAQAHYSHGEVDLLGPELPLRSPREASSPTAGRPPKSPRICAQLGAGFEQGRGGGGGGPSSGPERVEIEMHADEEDAEAVELVLRLMYKSALPAPTAEGGGSAGNAMLLAKAYSAADMFGIPRVMDLLAAALCARSTRDLGLEAVRALYSLPEDRAHLAPLLARCQDRLVHFYGDVPAIIAGEALREQFCALPYPAVLAWLKADDLKVHSENCVLFLLTAWVRSQAHAPCHPEQLEELACHVRVAGLSPSYLHSVLPNLDWFRSCEGARFLQLLMAQRLTGVAAASWDGPSAWQAKPRKRAGLPVLSLDWDITPGQLAAVYDGGTVRSQLLYANGTFARLFARVVKAADPAAAKKGAVTLGMFVEFVASAMEPALDADTFRKVVARREYTMQVRLPGSGSGYGKTCKQDKLDFLFENWGFPNLLQSSASSLRELLSGLLVEGQLKVRASGIKIE